MGCARRVEVDKGKIQRMYYTQCLLPIVLPVLFWGAYHYYKDRHLPEPLGHLLLTFVFGAGSFYLGLALYLGLGELGLRQDAYFLGQTSLAGLFQYSLLAIGPIEELAKLIPFLLVVLRFREFDEPIDGIIYASFIGLGFGAVENFYLLRGLGWLEAWGRAFAGPVLHIVFASIWGYYIGRAFLCRRKLIQTIFASFLVAAVLHGLYDFVVIGLAPRALPLAAALIVGAWIWRLARIRDLHALPPGRCP
jgi:RsiW-degrading membrane proteinase PrsW (M82 family)